MDPAGEGRDGAGQAGVQCELPPMIVLVSDVVMEPGKTSGGLTIELPDRLEDPLRSQLLEAARPVGERALEECQPFTAVGPARQVCGVLPYMLFEALSGEVAVGAGDLADRHERGLDDVPDQLGDIPVVRGRPERPVPGRNNLRLGDKALAGIPPGIQQLHEKRGVVGHSVNLHAQMGSIRVM